MCGSDPRRQKKSRPDGRGGFFSEIQGQSPDAAGRSAGSGLHRLHAVLVLQLVELAVQAAPDQQLLMGAFLPDPALNRCANYAKKRADRAKAVAAMGDLRYKYTQSCRAAQALSAALAAARPLHSGTA